MVTAEARLIRLRYPAVCAVCRCDLSAGSEGWWSATSHAATCPTCHGTGDASPFDHPVDAGKAGRSAQAEHERRLNARESRVRERFPRMGGVLLALVEPPQTTKAWASGAVGERRVAEALAKPEAEGSVVVLHDRRIPGGKANIDHVVVGPGGVFVVDTKRYVDAEIESRAGGYLYVNRRNKTHLVQAMARQVAAVERALGEGSEVPVMPVLCFVDSAWSLFQGPFQIGGVYITGPRGLLKHVTRPGSVVRSERLRIGHRLVELLPEA